MSDPYYPAPGPPEYSSRGQPGSGLPPMPYQPTHAEFAGPLPRPGTVLAGLIMTYVGSALLVLAGLVVLAFALTQGDEFARAFAERLGVDATVDQVRAVAIGAGIGILVQAAALIISAVFAHKGRNGGRIAITIIGGINVLLNLVQVASGQAVTLLPLVYVGVAVVLLWVGGANPWYREQRAARRARR